MNNNNNLSRFLEAQNGVYDHALKEIKNAKKISHWMWFIFPQISGLGFSSRANFYAIKNKNEATAYLNHEILGKRLIEICTELSKVESKNSVAIFGTIDNLKLKSSMTLFYLLDHTNPIFKEILEKFFDGAKDETTVRLLDNFN